MKYVIRVCCTGYIDVEVTAENQKEALKKAESEAFRCSEEVELEDFSAEDVIEEIDECAYGRILYAKDGREDCRYFILKKTPETEEELAEALAGILDELGGEVLSIERFSRDEYLEFVNPAPIPGQYSMFKEEPCA